MELCPLMSRLKSGIWPILGLKLAIFATFFKISTTNLLTKNVEPISAKNLAKIWPKWAQNFLEALIKNPSPLDSQEFSLLTAAKRIMAKY